MFLNILLLPLIGSIFGGLGGKTFGPKGSSFLTVISIATTFLLSFSAFIYVCGEGTSVIVTICPWIISGSFNLYWSLLFDTLTVVMLNVVCFISLLVHIYSTEYMSHDPHLPRFMSYLSLFTFFMIILVTGDNFIQLFVGWEGVGLCSYLLINFWFTRIQANKAAIKAMILNRVGDVGLALGIFTIFYVFQAVDYATVFALVPLFTEYQIRFLGLEIDALNLIGVLLFIGAMGKSAQLGLHTWLPDAMEGPTPVSALIHAATMVTAGVFLIARCSIIYEYAPEAQMIVTFFGAMTAFFAATTGLLQNDLKRVIAYSTCSQLGYMIFACGLSNYSVGVFHLSNHAFFKALLFLSAGSVIHAMADEQDMRKMGGLRRVLPFTYAMFVVGSFALMGLPFLAGFYSKDVILELAFAKYNHQGHFAYWLGSLAAFFTAFYSIRLLYLVFLSEPNGYRSVYSGVHDAPIRMGLPLAILAVPSILVGFLTKDMAIGFGTNFWGTALFVKPANQFLVDSEFIPLNFKLLPLCFAICGGLSSYFFYRFYSLILVEVKLSNLGRNIYTFLNRKWFFDKIYNEFFAIPLLRAAYQTTYKTIDKGFVEITGPKASILISRTAGKYINELMSGYTYHYAFSMLLGLSCYVLLTEFTEIVSNVSFLKTIILFVFLNFAA